MKSAPLLPALLLAVGSAWGAPPNELHDFVDPFLFSYGSWERAISVADGQAVIRVPDSKGGGGHNIHRDLSGMEEQSPALALVPGKGNRAKAIRVMMRDADEKACTFDFDLRGREPGVHVVLTPVHGASMAHPNEGDPLDLSRLTQVQILGNWSPDPVDLTIDRVLLVAPDAEITAARLARSEQERAEAEAGRQAVLAARAGIRHTRQSPQVERVYAADRDILSVAIIEGTLHPSKLVPYEAQDGDIIQTKDEEAEVVQGGDIRREAMTRVVRRQVNGRLQDVGFLAGGRVDAEDLWFLPNESVSGDPLETRTVMDPESYLVSATGDPGLATPSHPVAVHRKSKPLNRAFPNNEQVVRHVVYLRMPQALREGATYTIRFAHLNTREPEITHTHQSRQVRTEAIHTSHIGYRPDDPFKRAYLSLWLGDGGGHAFQGLGRFHLLDADGKAVFEGPVEPVLAIDGTEKVRPEMNLSQTAAYALDFSSFRSPGRYRVHIPGIGVSYPFTLDDHTWLKAFQLSMHGFLAQRSGIALGPPFTSFRRARSFHPDDGVQIYRSTTTGSQACDTGKYKNWFEGLVAGRTDQTVPGAWGGYNDAGDFDRSSNHLWATYLHLELLDLFPAFFDQVTLALPPSEANDALPDVLNEALWNIDCFRRLQTADGGVGAGIESSAHPRKGEDGPRDSLLLLAFASEPEPSYVYAATAGRAARVMQRFDPARAETYAASAIRAFDYAEAAEQDGKGYGGVPVADARNVAAAELLMLTADPRYDAIFRETSQWGEAPHVIEAQGGGFTYARLPEGVGDPALKAAIVDRIEQQAQNAIRYGDHNAFGLTVEVDELPLIGPVGAFTVPGMFSRILPRAHYLTGKPEYLAATVRACQFSAGANPDNRAFTTGVGHDPPRAPLHFESRHTGQPAPAGLTLYGAYEPRSLPGFAKGSDWVHIWMLPKTMFPPSRTWPSTEAYVDFFLWPMMNEFTIRQNMGPTSYYWGYLAARKAL